MSWNWDGEVVNDEGTEAERAEEMPDRRMITRWGGKEIIFADGFVAVPNTLIKLAPQLGVSATETVFLIVLMSFKWTEEMPFPSYERLAAKLSVSVQQARKLARQLEEKGLLRRVARIDRVKGRSSNEFDLTPLFDRLAFETLMWEKEGRP